MEARSAVVTIITDVRIPAAQFPLGRIIPAVGTVIFGPAGKPYE